MLIWACSFLLSLNSDQEKLETEFVPLGPYLMKVCVWKIIISGATFKDETAHSHSWPKDKKRGHRETTCWRAESILWLCSVHQSAVHLACSIQATWFWGSVWFNSMGQDALYQSLEVVLDTPVRMGRLPYALWVNSHPGPTGQNFRGRRNLMFFSPHLMLDLGHVSSAFSAQDWIWHINSPLLRPSM